MWGAGFVAGLVEAVVTQPLEVAKTRVQAHSLTAPPGAASLSMSRALTQVVRERGPTGLWLGLSTQLVQTSVKTSLRFQIYSASKPFLMQSDMLAGLFAGAMEALLWIQPTERIKVLRIAYPHRTTLESLRFVLLQPGGVRSLWRGGGATVARNSLTVGMRFSMYENIRVRLPSEVASHWAAPAALGFAAGAASTVLNNPLDVLKTRLNASHTQSYADFVRVIIHDGHLFQGLLPRLIKISIGQAVIFSVVDFINKAK